MMKALYIGGVSREPMLRLVWTSDGADHDVTIPLTRKKIEQLLRELSEALPHAPQ